MANEYLDDLQNQAGEIRKPTNPYLDTLQQEQQGGTAALRGNLSRSIDVNPDQYATKKRVASYLGYPTAAVEAQPQLETQAKIRQIDDGTQSAPVLRGKFTDADFAKLAHDDVGTLSTIEQSLRSAFRPVRALGSGLIGRTAEMASGVPETAVKFLAPLFDPLAGTLLPENPLRRVAAGLERSRKSATALGDTIRGDQTGAGFVEQSINSGFESFGAMLPGLAASVYTGNPQFMLGLGGAGSFSQASTKALDAGKSPMQAIGYGAADATAEIATEMLPVGRLLKDLKAGAPIITMLGRQIAMEVPTEMAATAWQGFNEWATLNSDQPISTYLEKLPEMEAQTIIATITQSVLTAGMGGAVRRIATRSERNQDTAQSAEMNTQVFADLDQLAAASKVRGRDPQSFQQFVEQAAADGPVQDIYIDAKALAQSGVIEQLVEASPAVAAQFEEALATGGDVRIPVGEYATTIAGTDLNQSLLDHLKTSPDAMSRAEAQEFWQNHSGNLETEIEQALGEKESADTFRQSAEVVRANLQGQLDAVARFTDPVNAVKATYAANFYAVTAAKMGTTPEELFARYPIKVAAERITGESLDQGAASLAEVQQQWVDAGIDNFVSERDGTITLSKIALPKESRNAGKGTAAMQALVEYADRTGQRIVLTPSSDFGGSKSRLVDFYKRFGFVENKGKNKDYTTQERMIRTPAKSSLAQSDTTDYNQDYGRPTSPAGPADRTGQDDATTVAGTPAERGWADATRAKRSDGQPARLWRGAGRALSPADFASDALGVASGNPSSGLGVWFSLSEGEASNYGDVEDFHLDIRKPAVIKIENLPGFDSLQDAIKFREALIAKGYDGIAIDARHMGGPLNMVAFRAEQVVYPQPSLDFTAEFNQSGKDQTQTEAFKTWSNDAPLIKPDELDQYEGGPAVFELYHGTAGDFTEFDRERANPESDMGAGFYFTNTPEDVSANYAGEGPDLTQRIQLLAERIASETDRDYGDPDVLAEAREQLAVEHGGMAMPVFVKVRNPVLVGGPNETQLTYEQPYDEETDEYGEETGTLVDFIVALRDVASQYHDGEIEPGIDAILQYAMDYGQMGASEVISALKSSEEFNYYTDENGTLVSTEIIRQAFERAGFDGIVDYTVNEKFGTARESGKSMAGMHEDTTHVIVFDPTQIKSAIGNRGTFDPNDPNILNQNKGGNRGAFNPATNTITLLKNADLSTWFHELGHFFLETTFDIAARPDAPIEIRQDADILLKWFGVESLEEWHALDFEEKRGHHETFARGTEAYLFEGKAPSAELQGLFQRVRAWMVSIYRDIKALNVELTDEVRGVMDRMLATTDEIKFAEQSRSMLPLFASPETSGMTPEEFAEYHKLGVDATNDAVQDLQAKGLRDMQWLHNARGREIKKLQRQASALRKVARMDVSREVMSEPIYQAWQFLTSKGEEGAPAGKIAIADVAGDDATWQRLRKLKMIAADGIPADTVAEMFGFSSGDQLVKALAEVPLPKDEIEARTDVRMLEDHGELSSDEAIEREADRAIHNDARARFIATETNALAKAVGKPKILADAAREFARQTVARLKLRDIRPSQYANAESRAAKNSAKALKDGDLETAAVEKRNQLVNSYATRAAYDAREEVERSVAYLKKFESAGVRKGLDAEYTDQIDTLLERFDLREQSNVAADRTVSLRTWVQSRLNAGEIPQIAESLLSPRERAAYLAEVQTRDEDGELVYADDEDQIKLLAEAIDRSARRPYRDLTVEEFRGLVDTVKQIEHLGRMKHKLLTARDQENYEAVRDDIAAGIAAEAKGSGKNTRTANDWLGKRLQSIKQFGAAHIKVATWARIMDGGKDNGPVWRYIVQPANERATQETTMRAEATAALDAIMRPVLDKVAITDKMGKGKFFPSIGDSLNWQERFAIALNVGNESNLQRLLGGKGWTIQQIKPVLDTLTAEEWQAAQAVWDHFESYRPMIAEKELRVSGKEPDWIAARQITVATADGQNLTLRGGYYPVVFDPRVNLKAAQHASAEEAKNLLKASYSAATTRRSFTKTRVDEVQGRPLLLNMQGLYSGVNDVIHDLAWHEWVIDANKLLRSKTIDSAMREHYGPEVKREFEKWRDDIVAGTRRLDHAIERAAGWARQSVSASALTFNVMSAAMQPLGLTNSMSRIGASWVAKGLARYVAGPIEATREAQAKSQWLTNRTRTRFRELNELRNQVQGQTAARELMGRYGYWMMMRAQMMVDVPTWWGAYEKAIAEGLDEQTAVNVADQSVKDAQGGGEEVDQSGIERGGPLVKLFTAFYGFMGTTLNTTFLSARTEASKAKIATNMALTLMVPAVIGSLLKDALTPGGDDDDEALVKKLIAEQLSFLMGLVAFGREFSLAAKVITGTAKGQGYSGPTGLRMVPDTLKLLQQTEQGEFDDGFRKSFVNVLGDLTGIPSVQINRSWTGAEALSDGETTNPAALVFGFQKQ